MATHGEIRRPPPGTPNDRLRGDSHGRRHPDETCGLRPPRSQQESSATLGPRGTRRLPSPGGSVRRPVDGLPPRVPSAQSLADLTVGHAAYLPHPPVFVHGNGRQPPAFVHGSGRPGTTGQAEITVPSSGTAHRLTPVGTR